MRTRMTVVLGSLLLLCGCGTSTVLPEADPVPTPYDGPMRVEQNFDDPAVLARSGAAGRALECDGEPYNGGGGDYDSGLESVQDDAAAALEDYFDNEGWAARWPDDGYRVEREDDDRVLMSWDVDQRTKVAFVVADGIRDYNGDRGWGVESWAQCNYAELTAEEIAELGVQVWEDRDGTLVPTTEVTSYAGPEHCDWQDITFLRLGGEVKGRQFLRDVDGELAEQTRSTYDGSATLPDAARDTGFHREGRELWVTRDAAYLVDLSDPGDVERWPEAEEPILCG
ncbi:MAG: hypothetical protein ABWX84_05570 [Nocardioides sp.]